MSARCQAVTGEDEAADEYIICGAVAPYTEERGGISAHLCEAHRTLLNMDSEVKVAFAKKRAPKEGL